MAPATGAPAGAVLEKLAEAASRLLDAANADEVIEVVRSSARSLCGASGVAIVQRVGDHCHYMVEESERPLWSGQDFPLANCISGWCMLNAAQAVVPDIYADPRLFHETYGPTGVQSLVMTPVGEPPTLALGAYWTEHQAPLPSTSCSWRGRPSGR